MATDIAALCSQNLSYVTIEQNNVLSCASNTHGVRETFKIWWIEGEAPFLTEGCTSRHPRRRNQLDLS